MSAPPPPEAPLTPCNAGPRLSGALTTFSLLGLLGCGAADGPPSPEPEAPEGIERESWEVELDLRGSISTVAVEAAYVADLADRITRADGGVTVTFADSLSRPATRVRADRLFIDHGHDVVGFSGNVTAEAEGPGIAAKADTLGWDRGTDSLSAPSAADLLLPDGRLSAARLAGDSGLASWSAEEVTGVLTGSGGPPGGDDGAGALHIEAAAADLRVRDGRLEAAFKQARAGWRDRRFGAHRAIYDGRTRRVVLEGAASMENSARQRRLTAEAIDVEMGRSRFAAAGGVRVEGEARLWADSIEEDGNRWRIQGDPALAEVDGRGLEARRLHLSEGTDTLLAGGGASAREGDRRITADSLRLVRPEDEVEAFGSVALDAADLEGDLRSGRLRSGAAGARLVLWSDARLTRPRRGGGELTLRADSLILEGSQRRLTGTGGFLLEAPPDLELKARRGVYATPEGPVSLFGEVEFVHRAGPGRSRLAADSSRVELAAGEPVALTWPGDLRGSLRGDGQTWLRAGSGRAALASGRLSSLHLDGRVEAIHRDPSEERLSRFTAERMEISFDEEGVLSRIVASGAAHVRLRLAGGGSEGEEVSLNDVRGERLEIRMRGGVVQAVHVIEGVEGRFEPGGRGG